MKGSSLMRLLALCVAFFLVATVVQGAASSETVLRGAASAPHAAAAQEFADAGVGNPQRLLHMQRFSRARSQTGQFAPHAPCSWLLLSQGLNNNDIMDDLSIVRSSTAPPFET